MAKQSSGEGGPKRRSKFAVSPEKFVTAWNTARTAQEAADKLGMPKAIAQARASKYRKAGVRLKKMRRGDGRRLDVEALNRLIDELKAKQDGAAPPPRGGSPANRKKGDQGGGS